MNYKVDAGNLTVIALMEGSSIGSPAITGYFTRVDVPSELTIGDEISIKVDGNLEDPTRSALAHWNGAFTAEGNGRKDCATFDGYGKVIGPEWAATLKLGPMPDTPVTIIVKLWGNPSAWAYRECPPGF